MNYRQIGCHRPKAFIEKLQANPASIASRKTSQNAIEAYYAHVLPEFLRWLCRLQQAPNLTLWSGSKPIRAHENVGGNYINYGVREFGMSAIMNGIALHGGFIFLTVQPS